MRQGRSPARPKARRSPPALTMAFFTPSRLRFSLMRSTAQPLATPPRSRCRAGWWPRMRTPRISMSAMVGRSRSSAATASGSGGAAGGASAWKPHSRIRLPSAGLNRPPLAADSSLARVTRGSTEGLPENQAPVARSLLVRPSGPGFQACQAKCMNSRSWRTVATASAASSGLTPARLSSTRVPKARNSWRWMDGASRWQPAASTAASTAVAARRCRRRGLTAPSARCRRRGGRPRRPAGGRPRRGRTRLPAGGRRWGW